MKIASLAFVVLIGTLGMAAGASADDAHKLVAPGDVAWKPAPKSLPAGAEAAVLFGDPSKEGLFVLRLHFPSGYVVPPHTHPVYEVVTVLSGAGKLGMGAVADKGATTTLPAGSFFALPPNMAHYAFYDEDTVIQITTNGPWGITYVNPDDDPRKTQ